MSQTLVVSKHLDPRLVSHCHVSATFRTVTSVTIILTTVFFPNFLISMAICLSTVVSELCILCSSYKVYCIPKIHILFCYVCKCIYQSKIYNYIYLMNKNYFSLLLAHFNFMRKWHWSQFTVDNEGFRAFSTHKASLLNMHDGNV